MNTFEIIPNEQTPKVPEIQNINEFLNLHRQELDDFLSDVYWRLNAAGLAANQVKINGERFMVRVFAIKSLTDNSWRLIVNPIINQYIGIKEIKCEGCLTWKGMVVVAERSRAVDVSYYDLNGIYHSNEIYKGFESQVWQHETNHLNGVIETVVEPKLAKEVLVEVGRNDKCPCGSNKKYKHCCLLLK